MYMLLILSLGAQGALRETQLLLIRHGRTQMNEHLAQPGKEWGAPNFADPGYYDTELTELGKTQARELHESFCESRYPPVDILISSPLRRALHTSEIVFSGHVSITQRIVTPLAAERLFLSSDVGSPVDELIEMFDSRWTYARPFRTHGGTMAILVLRVAATGSLPCAGRATGCFRSTHA